MSRAPALASHSRIRFYAMEVGYPESRVAQNMIPLLLPSVASALVRGNSCRFADRYRLDNGVPIATGAFGRVHRCMDNLARVARAVKRIWIPEDEVRSNTLGNEVGVLAALQHPHIVRLIEYFVEDGEVLLVMELLEGPSLTAKIETVGCFSESLTAKCLRHILKALFCCHCQGVAHNDVRTENFKFTTLAPNATLKMVDFGFSERCSKAMPHESPEATRSRFVQKRDVWRTALIFYEMIAGCALFPDSPSGITGPSLDDATDPYYVPAKLGQLGASDEARELLRLMFEPSTDRRLAANEALQHHFITRYYVVDTPSGGKFTLQRCLDCFCNFHCAVRLKRLALLVVAHLLSSTSATVAAIHWLFRYLVRDGWQVEEATMRQCFEENDVEVPDDFHLVFKSVETFCTGGLNYIEFLSAAIINSPEIYCRSYTLSSAFRFLDAGGSGFINADGLQTLLRPLGAENEEPVALIREACESDRMSFDDFTTMMVPADWETNSKSGMAAVWANAPDTSPSDGGGATLNGSSLAAAFAQEDSVRVKSAPSESFAICQKPRFHVLALCPYYDAQTVSNVVIGIIRGTSSYARRSVQLGLAEIAEVGGGNGTDNGVFFFMPNPKYHWSPEDAAFREDSRFRFVAWWIHPDFAQELRDWVARTSASEAVAEGGASPKQRSQSGVGAPGDFGYSEVEKPKGYLHTYRELSGVAHLQMLEGLVAHVKGFMERVLGSVFPSAHLSAGFHYPVRPQYSTLHLQLRVNSGDVCGGKENRGIDLFQLLPRLRADPEAFIRDEETLRYRATANLRAAVVAAASSTALPVHEIGPASLELG
mmetsp:Transcript_80627/g.224371  ORF Transcript_80627/g.224371 Transcript_80627/m.224371 type:complete len:824 (-) Transcript_80627:134-2605(-)